MRKRIMKIDMQNAELSRTLQPKTVETVQGIVEYVEIGDGPAVVALHGAMGGYDQSLILAQTIGGIGYRYIAVSRPGYLGTPMSSGGSPEQQGDLVAALLDALDIRQAGVFVVSGGGAAGVQFGLRHPQRCLGLVLASTYADKTDTPIPFSFKLMKFLARWPWFVQRFRKKAENDLEAVAGRSIQDPDVLKRTLNDNEIWPLFSTMLLSTYHRMGERLEGTENDISSFASTSYPLENMKPPVLVVHGTRDRLVPYELHAKQFEARIPGAELLTLDGGEHVAIFTHREIVRPKVSEFMQRYFTE
jgi:pimeloyl-ACP methyl ester carboxylesterase